MQPHSTSSEIVGEHGVVRVVFPLFLRRQIHEFLFEHVVGQVGSGEIIGFQFVDYVADQPGQQFVPLVFADVRCRQPHAEGRCKKLGNLTVAGSGKVVDFVEHDEHELVAQLFGADVRGIVRGHGDRLKAVLSPSVGSHVHVELFREISSPLFHQVYGGNDHDGRSVDGGDRCHGNNCLSSAGWQHDDASSSRTLPRSHRLFLIAAELGLACEFRTRGQVQHVVFEVQLAPTQKLQDIGIIHRQCAEGTHSGVPAAIWNLYVTPNQNRSLMIPQQNQTPSPFSYRLEKTAYNVWNCAARALILTLKS